jgi:GST-like protein
MAFWGWARMIPFVLGLENAWVQFPQIKRLLGEIGAREASTRAEALKTRHAFKAELDEEAKDFLFPQNIRLKGLRA